MPVYVVSYDLTRPGQNYDTLWEAFKKLEGRRVLPSQWRVNARGDSAALRDHLRQYMDATDRVLVMSRDSGDWASYNLLSKLNN